ncbi:hypothetical protein BH23ACT9_BH23ACT9_34640 [soil metagenome]
MLVLFHDVTDPASAVAVARCTRLAREGVPIEFDGFEAVGIDVTMPPDVEVLALLDRLGDEAASEGLHLRRPRSTPPTGLAHVLLAHAEPTPAAHDLRLAVYRAYWTGGADLTDHAVLTDLAVTAGLDGAAVDALLADRVELASRRRRMAAHRREGIGGVPVVLASRTLLPGLMTEQQLRDLAAAV